MEEGGQFFTKKSSGEEAVGGLASALVAFDFDA